MYLQRSIYDTLLCSQRESNCYYMKPFLYYLSIRFSIGQSSNPQSKKLRLFIFQAPLYLQSWDTTEDRIHQKNISFVIFQSGPKWSDFINRTAFYLYFLSSKTAV